MVHGRSLSLPGPHDTAGGGVGHVGVDGFIVDLITVWWRFLCVLTSSDMGGSFMIG